MWTPRRPWPDGLVSPRPIDPRGLAGPTRGRAHGPRWRRTAPGLFLPADTPASPEQRILEAATGLPSGAAVTGWAALRLLGGGFFDGREKGADLPVPVALDRVRRPRPRPGVRWVRPGRTRPMGLCHDLPCVAPEWAVLDAMAQAADDREAVVVMDMAAAARITSIRRVTAALARSPARLGAQRCRWALEHASERSLSPPEVRLRLVWILDAELPPPLVNPRVLRRGGGFIGRPDLLGENAGVAGEYDGALHRGRERHRRDTVRSEGFRDVRIEGFVVVAGDAVPVQVARMRRAHARALWVPAEERCWMVGPDRDANGAPVRSLDEELGELDPNLG